MAEIFANMVKPLSHKAKMSIRNTGYLNVWEGAVRSGKTVASSIAWLIYVTLSSERYFLMSGKTLSTLYRNVIEGDFGMLALAGDGAEYKTDAQGIKELLVPDGRGGKKVIYCFGAYDERSFMKMRGVTVGGWYADEVSLHPKSFIEEAFRRTIVSSDRRHYWTLNPDNPYHFIYIDYLDKYARDKLPGYHYWKFTLDDNYAISDERKEELKRQFSGIFYRRYILGERCVAEGVIYDMVTDENYIDDSLSGYYKMNGERYISVDYGTKNPCVFLSIYDDGDTIFVDRELSWDSQEEGRQKTDSEYVSDMEEFMKSGVQCSVICDPSALSFISELKNRGFFVKEACNEVLDGIRVVSTLFAQRKLKINRQRCPRLVKELSGYSWNPLGLERGVECPIKVNDHACDALRYFCMTAVPAWRTGMNIIPTALNASKKFG